MSMVTLYAVFCGVLIIIGIACIVEGFPYLSNSSSTRDRISAIRNYFFEKIPAWIYVKMETYDAFTANNPIDVEVTIPLVDLNEIKGIQLTFEGANKYFPNIESYPPPPIAPYGSPPEVWDEYSKTIEEYWDNYREWFEEKRNTLTANILLLQSDKDYDNYFPEGFDFPEHLSKPSTFSGSLQNLTYSVGGKFDIGITLTTREGYVIGYGLSDLSYVLKDALEVSPSEALLQIRNNNTMTGLGWIGIGLPFLIAGLTGLLEIFKHFAFSSFLYNR